jgi:hypothetical protein
MTKITLKKPATAKQPANDKRLAAIVSRIKARNDSYAVETGRDLLKAKAMLKHGEIGPWLKSHFGWSAKTAQNYMNAAKLAEKNENVSHLKPSAAMALAAPGTPETVKSEVLADLDAGKVPTPKEVKAKIAAAKPAKVAPVTKATKAKLAIVPADLVERLQKVGLDVAAAAMDEAFPGVRMTIEFEPTEDAA